MKILYVLLPTHNRVKTTEKCLKCILEQSYKNIKIILLDDGSKDDTTDMVCKYFPTTIVLEGDGNWWWAGSLQRGREWLRNNADNKDYVVILNDDSVFENNYFNLGIELLNENRNKIIGSYAYDLEDNSLLDCGISINWNDLTFNKVSTVNDINCLSTRGLFMFVGDFLNIGGFHPFLLPHYFSDYEFTIRAYRKGYKLITDPMLKLWDDQSISGIRDFNDKSHLKLLAKVFSKKSSSNPIYWTTFVILACPWKWKIQNVLRIWLKVIKFAINFYKNKVVS